MRRLLVATLMTATLVASSAWATTINVPADVPTIQEGIQLATDGDVVLVAPGTYHESISLLGKAITVRSADGPDVTTIDGSGAAVTILCCKGEGSSTVVEGFTVTGSTDDGIACAQGVGPRFVNLRITGNESNAVTVAWASAAFESVHFTGNGMFGLWAYAGEVTFSDCYFNRNGFSAFFAEGGSSVVAVRTTLDGIGQEYPTGYAPVLFITSSFASFTECSFSDYASRSVPLSVYPGSTVQFMDCSFQNNHRTSGDRSGVLYCAGSDVTLSGCNFVNNSTTSYGGACHFFESHVSISDSRFEGNRADAGSAGAIKIDGGCTVELQGCEFLNNQSWNSGGALQCVDGENVVDIGECLFVGNVSQNGSVFEFDNCTGSISHSTIYDCSAHSNGAVVSFHGLQAPVLQACIIAFCEGTGIEANSYTAFPSISYCDVYACDGGNYGGVIPDLTGYYENISADPMFCDPGGLDFTLDAASPCSGAGPFGSDIGAFGVGCGASPVEATSWGRVKAMYR